MIFRWYDDAVERWKARNPVVSQTVIFLLGSATILALLFFVVRVSVWMELGRLVPVSVTILSALIWFRLVWFQVDFPGYGTRGHDDERE